MKFRSCYILTSCFILSLCLSGCSKTQAPDTPKTEIESETPEESTPDVSNDIPVPSDRDLQNILSDASLRPLNATDLLIPDKEHIAFIRDELASVPSSEETSFRLIERNLSFLQEAELYFDETIYQENLAAYQQLEPSPYLSLLQDGEISLLLNADSAEDMGIYYKATGSIAIPVMISKEEYQSLQEGAALELCTNEFTGRTIIITHSDNTEFSSYDEGNPYIIIDDGNYLDVANFRYMPEKNAYLIWFASDDTIFKTIYEGDIYVLKGASVEYFHHFVGYETPLEEFPGIYQLMDFDEEPSDFGPNSYYGNYPVFDEKGYIKALYFYGD